MTLQEQMLSHQRSSIHVQTLPIRLDKDIRRVVTLPFDLTTYSRVTEIYDEVDRLTDDEVAIALESVLQNFGARHRRIEEELEEHYRIGSRLASRKTEDTPERRQLLGAYFTMEYSLQAAALFNPSIVAHPEQEGVPDGGLRFIMSLRAVGEGHLSSTIFQTGIILKNGAVALDPSNSFSARTRVRPDQRLNKELFIRKLNQMNVDPGSIDSVLGTLGDWFALTELESAMTAAREAEESPPELTDSLNVIAWLARANYELQLAPGDSVSDLILFPRSDTEARGIEDMRLVQFTGDDGTISYYGTYTAFNGQRILPMLLETNDFRTLRIHTLNGACAQNKGMALFPRKIDGHFVNCSRIDGRNLYLMFSDFVHFWETAEILATPKYVWELRLMGNCGSPIETPEGWLLLTHGVGPMRRYCIGAMLLDHDDPFRIRGRLREPLIAPTEDEREGYVPNVVYSCGALVHGNKLILPYAVSDTATRMAAIRLDQLLDRLLSDGPG